MPGQTESSDQGNSGSFRGFGEKDEVLNVRAEMIKRRGWVAALIDQAGRRLAHPPFFIALLVFHLLWIVLNLRIIPGLEPWDPYPFTFLATIASVEAPFISLLVLMRQHRDERVAELREEVDLQVSLHIEREVTAVLRMLGEVQDALKVQTRMDGEALQKMEQPLDAEHLMDHLEKHLDESEGEDEEQE